MQFTKEDQYLTQALTERFKNKYGDVAVVAINDNQIMAISGGLSSGETITQLNKVIEQLRGKSTKKTNAEKHIELTTATKVFVEYAKMDLEESNLKALKNHLKYLEDKIEFNGYEESE